MEITPSSLLYAFKFWVGKLLKYHPKIEELCIFVRKEYRDCTVTPDQIDEFARFLNTFIRPRTWEDEENMLIYRHCRGEKDAERKLKILFSVKLLDSVTEWDENIELDPMFDPAIVEGLPGQELEEKWTRMTRDTGYEEYDDFGIDANGRWGRSGGRTWG